MIHVELKELGPEWDEWKKEATEETNRFIDAVNQGKTPEFNKKIWKELKPFLENLFHRKCAYCEAHYGHVSYADIDHYRPKLEVAEEGKTHPGYYWLAYDYHNMLPTCNICNRGGKRSHFPIKGKRAHHPGHSLAEEKPLLLNPYTDKNIEDHITFGIKGIIVGKTEEGQETIKIYNLNRESLQTKRQQSWECEKKSLYRKIVKDDSIGSIISPAMEYSAYLRESLIRYYHKKKQERKTHQ